MTSRLSQNAGWWHLFVVGTEQTLHGLLMRAQALARAQACPRVDVPHLTAATDWGIVAIDAEDETEQLPLTDAAQRVVRTAAELARRAAAGGQHGPGVVRFIRTAAAMHTGRRF